MKAAAWLVSIALFTAPLARAQDDEDLPDGDVDAPAQPAPPPKKPEEPKKDGKKKDAGKKPAPAPATPPRDDDDILSPDDGASTRAPIVPITPIEEAPPAPAPTPAAPPARIDDDEAASTDGTTKDDAPRAASKPRASIDDGAPPAEEDEGMDPWLITGITAGAVALVAAAAVGGYFLIDALTVKTGTVTVTPH